MCLNCLSPHAPIVFSLPLSRLDRLGPQRNSTADVVVVVKIGARAHPSLAARAQQCTLCIAALVTRACEASYLEPSSRMISLAWAARVVVDNGLHT